MTDEKMPKDVVESLCLVEVNKSIASLRCTGWSAYELAVALAYAAKRRYREEVTPTEREEATP